MRSSKNTLAGFAGVFAIAAGAVALTTALPAGAAGPMVQYQPTIAFNTAQSKAPGGLTHALPDIIPTTLGFIMKSGPVGWGQTEELNPNQADATQVGPQQNLCRFHPGAYRTHNKGAGNAGAFVTKVYRDNTLIHTHNVPGGLAAYSGIDWHQFTVDLKEGMNTIRVNFDANKQVAESNENNSYFIKVNVKIDCNGDGKIGGVAINPNGGFKATPGQGDPSPAKPQRRLRPRG